MRVTPIIVASLLSAAVAFSLHVATVYFVMPWVGSQMEGVEVKQWPYGLEVTVPAAISAIEYGLGYLCVYLLLRSLRPYWPTAGRAALASVLCLAVSGALVRAPLMQLVIGNPPHVVLVQQGAEWLTVALGCFVVAFVYEGLAK